MLRRFVASSFYAVFALFLVALICSGKGAEAQPPVFGSVNLCPAGKSTPAPCGLTQQVTVNVAKAGTIAIAKVVTGGQENLDFTYANGGSCSGDVVAGSSCTVNVTFRPQLAGSRLGAVRLVDSGGNVLGTAYIRGTGIGPQIGYSLNGGTATSVGVQNADLRGVASDSAGNFYVVGLLGQLWELPANGGPLITLAANQNYFYAVTVDGAGNVFVSGSDGITEIPAGGGTPTPYASGWNSIFSLASDGAGNVYGVSSPYQQPSQIVEFPAGGGSPIVIPGNFVAPGSIAADADGNLFVEDGGSNQGYLYKLPAGGGPQIPLAGPGFYEYDLALDGTGNLYTGSGFQMIVFPAGGGDPYPLNIYQAYGASGSDFTVDPAGNIFTTQNGTTLMRIQRSGPPPALSFATTNDGSTSSDSPKSVEIINSGNQPLVVSSLLISPDFAQQTTSGTFADCGGSFTLAPGVSCNVSISFNPVDGGLIQGAVTVTDNTGNNANAIQSIGLSGTGLVLQQTTTSISANTAHTTYSQPVTLTAVVTAPVGIPVGSVTFANGSTVLGTATLDGTGAASLTTAALPVGANLVTASYVAAVNYLASVSSPVSVTVNSDEATAGAANVCAAGKSSPAPCSKTVTVTYLAATATTLGTPVVVTQGAPNLDYTLASTTCNGSIAAGASCTVTVKFAPKYPGPRAGGVQIVDSTGAVLATFNIQGSGTAAQIAFNPGPAIALTQGDYMIDQPNGFATDGAGNVYVASSDGIIRYAATTHAQSLINGTPSYAVNVDGAGNIYLFDGANIVELPVGGGPQFVVTSGLSQAYTMTMDAAGSIYVATTTQILKIAGDTKAQTVLVDGLTDYVVGLAVDGGGNLYGAGTSGNILKIPAGCANSGCQGVIPTVGPYPLQAIAVDPAGNLYITYQYGSEIYQLPADGSPAIDFASDPHSFGYTGSIAVDQSGNLYIIDLGYEQLYELPRSHPQALQFTTTNTNTVSSDSPQSIIAQNIGNASLSLSNLKVSTNFLQTAGPGAPTDCAAGRSLAIGARCNLSINFAPKTGGAITGSAVLTDNNLGVSGSIQTAALTGTGFVLQKQTISFVAVPAQVIGATVGLSAVSSSGLIVSLASLTPSICSVSGTTATMTGVGSCSIQATQAGNSTYLPAIPVTRSFAVKLKPQTIAFASIPAQFVGASVTASATSTSGLSVVFTSSTPSVCTVSGATVASLAAGTCTIQADQPGDGTYAAAPTVTRSFTVKLQAQTITFASIPAQTMGTPLVLAATSSSGLAVSFASTTPTVCSVTNRAASFLMTGTCTIQATQAGNNTYAAAAAVNRSFTVKLALQTINFPAIPAQSVGASFSLSATATSGLPVSFSSATISVCTVAGETAAMIKKGSCKIVASQAGNGTFAATSLSQTFAVN